MRSQLLRIATSGSESDGSHKDNHSKKKLQPALFPFRF
jgi:hypothetical protein